MAISTIDQLVAGMQPPIDFFKTATPTLVAGRPHSLFYLAGIPGASPLPIPGLSGEALTSYEGQLPFNNPVAGNTYLARLLAAATVPGALLLYDRLWHCNGFTVTSTGAHTINSVAFPPRDAHGSANGVGVMLGVEVSATTGSPTPTITVGYTNSDDVSGRTATNIIPVVATSAAGAFYPIGLQAGDVGVRSIQTLTLSVSWVGGNFRLVAYRVLARLELPSGLVPGVLDAVTGGMPRLYDNTVPFLLFIPSATTASTISGSLVYTQG